MPSESRATPSHARPGVFDLLATCNFGLEAVVARELSNLGYDSKPVGTGRILFTGDHRAICDANLWLRAADRVLVRIAQFPVGGGNPGFDTLFETVKSLPWENWISREAAFPVAGRSVRSLLTSEPALQRTVKKAIVERLQRAHARNGVPAMLPETGPRVAVEVSLLRDVATLTIDTSGVGLHKRGYREGSPGEAALKETMAAGLVLLSVWRPGRPLVDPFCGSGTIPIEAAMIGRNIAPGLNRSFDAEHWASPTAAPGATLIDPKLWHEAREDAVASIIPDRLNPVIHASDISEQALRFARDHARIAGVERDIQFLKRAFADLSTTLDYGCIITNPPYGVRLGDEEEIERLYRSMPLVLRKLPTWSVHILSGRLDLERIFGQVATRRRKLYNSKIECCYFTFLGPRPPGDSAAPDVSESTDLASPSEFSDLDPPSSDAAPDQIATGDTPATAPLSPPVPPPQRSPPRSVLPPPAPPPAMPTFGGLRERDVREAGEFRKCLTNNLRHLRRYPSRGILCYRIYERDVPDVPLIVDRYQDRFHAAEYERQHSRTAAQQADWFDLMRRTIAEVGEVPIDNVYMKEKHRQRGLTQHEKIASARDTIIVQEGTPPLRFEVNLSDYVDTGLFLDHRLTRQMVREQSAGKRVLNLFSYTGSFSVYAASGGARSTTSVDLSNTYLEWAERNFALNALASPAHTFIRSDVLEFLRTHPRREQYDLAIVDPPTFSNSKSTQEDWEVAESHVELFHLLTPLLTPGAVVYFSTNYRRFKLDHPAIADAGLQAREISGRTVPPEYRNKRIHRCWRMVNIGVQAARTALAGRSTEQKDAVADDPE